MGAESLAGDFPPSSWHPDNGPYPGTWVPYPNYVGDVFPERPALPAFNFTVPKVAKWVTCPQCGTTFDMNDTIITWEQTNESGRGEQTKKTTRALIRVMGSEEGPIAYECGVCDNIWSQTAPEGEPEAKTTLTHTDGQYVDLTAPPMHEPVIIFHE